MSTSSRLSLDLLRVAAPGLVAVTLLGGLLGCTDDEFNRASESADQKQAKHVRWVRSPGDSDQFIDEYGLGPANRYFVQLEPRVGVETEHESEIVALDAGKGTEKWRRPTPGLYPLLIPLGEAGVFVGADDEILALDPATGETLWAADVPARSIAVAPWGFIAHDTDKLAGVEEGGAVRWTYESPRHEPLRFAVDPEGNTYVVEPAGYGAGDVGVALKLSPDGEVLWTDEFKDRRVDGVRVTSGGAVIVDNNQTGRIAVWRFDDAGHRKTDYFDGVIFGERRRADGGYDFALPGGAMRVGPDGAVQGPYWLFKRNQNQGNGRSTVVSEEGVYYSDADHPRFAAWPAEGEEPVVKFFDEMRYQNFFALYGVEGGVLGACSLMQPYGGDEDPVQLCKVDTEGHLVWKEAFKGTKAMNLEGGWALHAHAGPKGSVFVKAPGHIARVAP